MNEHDMGRDCALHMHRATMAYCKQIRSARLVTKVAYSTRHLNMYAFPCAASPARSSKRDQAVNPIHTTQIESEPVVGSDALCVTNTRLPMPSTSKPIIVPAFCSNTCANGPNSIRQERSRYSPTTRADRSWHERCADDADVQMRISPCCSLKITRT